jgi:hypothetical protein
MESIATFYQMLFTVEIAIFGILAAALFVFIQLVYGHFSYRHISIVLKSPSLLAYGLLSIATLFVTGIASFSLLFQRHDLLPQYNFSLQNLFIDESVAIIILLAFFLSLILFASYAFFSIWYLRPHKMAQILRRKIKIKAIRDYLLKQYGIPSPEVVAMRAGIIHSIVNRDCEENSQTEDFEALAKARAEYNRLERQVKNAKDPLEVLNALILRIINEADLISLSEIRYVIRDIAKDFFKAYKKTETDQQEIWSPNDGISRMFLEK